ncbi:aspartate dehydrogenase domain-containing protein [Amycolatopsis granulosa]|uniref:aspartate dehydrogenase domain-containing protein n=1 Tax=Amycolatopsis granulosa TaxID=185684 RepID=UPI0014234FDF|nr:aspartate dehydrogenase domain-containing protein [Amycolatopsis granulosa]NIH84431.1 aspartate dehydrogenase [Amycolatopsis granulosa]
MRAGVIGAGSIGGVVARALRDGSVPDAVLSGVLDPAGPPDLPVLTLDELLSTSDLVVEAAGQRALAELGPRVLAAGRDLLVVSVGALADDALLEELLAAGPGELHLSTGAIGGLDLLRAAARMAPLSRVTIETTKLAANLVQPWMSAAEAERLRTASAPVELMRGPARKVTAAFPKSANVAASVALAVGDWDAVEAVVVADPGAELTSHVITAQGTAGSYRFEIRNQPSPVTPTSSAVVPHAVLGAIAALARPRVVFR